MTRINATREQIEFDYLITPDGLEYSWHDVNSPLDDGRWLLTFEGQGLPPLHYITQRGPYQHGITVLDKRLDPRIITYLHHRSACNRQGYWETRRDVANHCRVNRQTPNTPFKLATLRKVFPNGTMRDIDVTIENGSLYGVPRSLDKWRETRWTETFKWLAPDPSFYDPTMVVVGLGIELCNDLVFPFDFPFIFCGESFTQTDTVVYTGDWQTNPVIQFTGPWNTGAYIRSLTTNRLLQFTRPIPAGTTITIDTRYGLKRVTDNVGQSWMGALTSDSDLNWAILPDPEAPGGINSISAGGTGGVAGLSKIELQYYTRYQEL